jgi:prepilin-type N-terminal cleavage/methylation domain-containing protein
MNRPSGAVTAHADRNDRGFTLLEVTIVLVVLGIVMSALALAVSVALRANPDTEARLDDSRSTRSLATWLSYDTSSTPPFATEQAQGGMVTSEVNDCGGPGANLLQLKWVEAAPTAVTYVSSYRFIVQPEGGEIVRVTCKRIGSGSFGSTSTRTLTSNLKPSAAPTVNLVIGSVGEVTKVSFALTGNAGESVLVETASRNPADFFP